MSTVFGSSHNPYAVLADESESPDSFAQGFSSNYAEGEMLYENPITHAPTGYPVDSYIRFGIISRIACACIPVLGAIFASLMESSIAKRMVEHRTVEELKEFLSVKNQFKISAIINSILTVAAVASVALLLLIPSPASLGIIGGAVAVGAAFIAFKAYQLHQNQPLFNEPLSQGISSCVY